MDFNSMDCNTCVNKYLDYRLFCDKCDPDYSNWESQHAEGMLYKNRSFRKSFTLEKSIPTVLLTEKFFSTSRRIKNVVVVDDSGIRVPDVELCFDFIKPKYGFVMAINLPHTSVGSKYYIYYNNATDSYNGYDEKYEIKKLFRLKWFLPAITGGTEEKLSAAVNENAWRDSFRYIYRHNRGDER